MHGNTKKLGVLTKRVVHRDLEGDTKARNTIIHMGFFFCSLRKRRTLFTESCVARFRGLFPSIREDSHLLKD